MKKNNFEKHEIQNRVLRLLLCFPLPGALQEAIKQQCVVYWDVVPFLLFISLYNVI